MINKRTNIKKGPLHTPSISTSLIINSQTMPSTNSRLKTKKPKNPKIRRKMIDIHKHTSDLSSHNQIKHSYNGFKKLMMMMREAGIQK